MFGAAEAVSSDGSHKNFCHTLSVRVCVDAHSHKDRPPHTGHLGPWDLTSVPAAGWSPGERERENEEWKMRRVPCYVAW